jgi:flagellar basal-body rod modification protein FlgD
MVNAVSAAVGGSGTSGALARARLTSDDFMKILVTELTHQDPLEPMRNSEFVQQLVGLQSLEQTAALTDGLKSFESFLQMSSASGLIGKTVKGAAADGTPVEGVVSRVLMEEGQVSVLVGATRVPVSSLTEIFQA